MQFITKKSESKQKLAQENLANQESFIVPFKVEMSLSILFFRSKYHGQKLKSNLKIMKFNAWQEGAFL
ncbi:MAG TPA: hypothetical protein P5268_09665 [Candidatus Marinimicrobia bacterium]|nr:hypothetical protein [Candidatus Neomarinimicrobiota bacterium]HRU93279.1 hypothetical protein [Candidatus Neomarinimicrobiota bacterium]